MPIAHDRGPSPLYELIGTYISRAIVPPLLVWICWRTVLWVARGFVSERAR